jgi:hypothetical protein
MGRSNGLLCGRIEDDAQRTGVHLHRGSFVHAPLVSKRYDGNVGWGSCCDSQSPGRTRLHSDIFEYRLGPGRDVHPRRTPEVDDHAPLAWA